MSAGIWEWFLGVLQGTLKEPTISVTEKFALTGGENRMQTPIDTMILFRNVFTDRSTIGELFIDGSMECFTLEPTCRKQAGVKQAIQIGKYEIVMYESPKLKANVEKWKAQGKDLHPLLEAGRVPLLLNVPDHTFVEIHPGNRPEDTEDCILPGKGHDTDWVSDSVDAWIQLVAKVEAKLTQGRYFIGITGGGQNAG